MTPRDENDCVLSIRGLDVEYPHQSGPAVRAVRDLDLDLRAGELLGLAGESGCGKSTLAYAVLRLLREPARVTRGSVLFRGRDGVQIDVLDLSEPALRRFRWRRVAMVFQSAMNALNPVLRIRVQLDDVLRTHLPDSTRQQRRARCGELLELVGIDPGRADSYPHELSGGMRQRVMIAMALALRPDVVVMDEPTTALDVVVQREILDEIDRLRRELGFAVVFITHDLSLLMEISDRIAVMYAGRIVESAPVADLRTRGFHPYTAALLGAFPSLRGPRRLLRGVPGHPPDLAQPLHRCAFADRCPYAIDACTDGVPPLLPAPGASPGHVAACVRWDPRVDPHGPPEALRRGEFAPATEEVPTP